MTHRQLLTTPESAAVLVGAFYVLLILAGTLAAILLIAGALRRPVDWEERIRWLKDRPWSWREALGLVAMVGVLIGLAAGIATLLHKPREATLVVLQSILMDGAGLALMAALVLSRGWGWDAAFGMGSKAHPFFRKGLLFYLAMMPFTLFASLVYQGILYANGYPPNLQEIALFISGEHPLWLRLYMIGLAIALAPVFEECLFRGILLPILVRTVGAGAGIFLTSLLFASIHMHLPSLAPLLVVASGLSLAYLYTGSLWVPIVMHSLFNGVNLALLLVIRH